MNNTLTAGAARCAIPLPSDVCLSGYSGREQPSIGVLDPVHVRALALGRPDVCAVLCVADLVGFDVALARRIREAIAQRLSIPRAAVLLAATHTHSGPSITLLRDNSTVPSDFPDRVLETLVDAASAAVRALTPAHIGQGFGSARLAVNRRMRNGPVDDGVGGWVITAHDGRTVAALCRYSCHPTVLGFKNRYVSADFPGRVCAALEQRLSSPAVGFYLNGPSGDVMPSLYEGGPDQDSTWNDPARALEVMSLMGETLAEETLRAAAAGGPPSAAAIDAAETVVQIPLRPLPSVADMHRAVEPLQAAARRALETHDGFQRIRYESAIAELQWTQEMIGRLQSGHAPEFVEADVQVLRVGSQTIAALPGEAFVRLGRAVQKALQPLPALVVACCNGNIGYIPDASVDDRPLPDNDYEVGRAYKFYGFPAAVSAEAEGLLTRAFSDLARTLHESMPGDSAAGHQALNR